jgi:hypothetical protein
MPMDDRERGGGGGGEERSGLDRVSSEMNSL